jgi:hypothetical protein
MRRRAREVGVLDDRRDLTLDDLPPYPRVVEAREVAANRQPQLFGLWSGDAERSKPIRDRRIRQVMQRARRKRVKLASSKRAAP